MAWYGRVVNGHFFIQGAAGNRAWCDIRFEDAVAGSGKCAQCKAFITQNLEAALMDAGTVVEFRRPKPYERR